MHSPGITAVSALSLLFAASSQACMQHLVGQYDSSALFDGHHNISITIDEQQISLTPRPARSDYPPRQKTALSNVRIFDGYQVQPASTIFFDGDTIVDDAHNVDIFIDGHGGILLPGLIDSHAHPNFVQDLEALSSYGVTTVMSMACKDYERCAGLRDRVGLTSFFTAGIPAHGPESPHAIAQKDTPDKLIWEPRQAPQWVENVFNNGSDYLKITAERNGPNQATQDAIVALAHAKGKKVMTHAAEYEYYKQAIDSGADGPQHIPMDQLLTPADIEQMLAQKMFATPTVNLYKVVLQKLSVLQPDAAKTVNFTARYGIVSENVLNLHVRGVPVLAGTDSTVGEYPISLPFGDWLHEELLDLVEIGLTPAEALRAATIVPATAHELHDRGRVATGMRADLVLLRPHADPLANIRDTRSIARVWNGGVEFHHLHPNSKVAQAAEHTFAWWKTTWETLIAALVVGVASLFGISIKGKMKLF